MGNLLHLISWSHGVGCIECLCHTPNSTGVIYVTILPPDFFFFTT